MISKRLKELVLGSAALAALACGGSASAAAATSTGSSSSATIATPQKSSDGGPRPGFSSTHASETATHVSAATTVTADAGAKISAAPPASVRGGSVGAMNHVRDSWIHDLYLTDHEHHDRLASAP
jgi:hypothetical protein